MDMEQQSTSNCEIEPNFSILFIVSSFELIQHTLIRYKIVVDPLFKLTAGVPTTMSGTKGTYQYFTVANAELFQQSLLFEVSVEGAGDPDLYISQSTVYPTAMNFTWESAKDGAELISPVNIVPSIPLNIGIYTYSGDA